MSNDGTLDVFTENVRESRSSLREYYVARILALDENHLIKKNLCQVRDIKRKIILTETDFFMELNDYIMNTSSSLVNYLSNMNAKKIDVPDPMFRSEHKRLMILNSEPLSTQKSL